MLTTAQSLTAAQKSQARSNIGAAPEKLGIGDILGTMLTANNNLNDNRANGLYQWAESTPANSPLGQYCQMWVYRWGTFQADVVWAAGNPTTRVIRVHSADNSEVTEVWENPPMQVGTEYRTTERYRGKAVYCKVLDCGALPNNTYKEIATGLTGGSPLAAYGTTLNPSSGVARALPVGYPSNSPISLTFEIDTLYISTNTDLSAYTNTFVVLKYIKP